MGSLWITCVVFVVSLSGCQIVMRRLGPRRKFWQWIDYVWLSALAIGMIPATGKARQMIAAARIESTEIYYRATVRRAYSLAAYNRDYYANRNSSGIRNEKERLKVQAAFAAAAQWFADATERLSKFPASTDWRELEARLADLEQIDHVNVRDEARRFANNLLWIQEAEEEYESLTTAASRNLLEFAVVALSPLLVAFALAIRITKVTATRKGFA